MSRNPTIYPDESFLYALALASIPGLYPWCSDLTLPIQIFFYICIRVSSCRGNDQVIWGTELYEACQQHLEELVKMRVTCKRRQRWVWRAAGLTPAASIRHVVPNSPNWQKCPAAWSHFVA